MSEYYKQLHAWGDSEYNFEQCKERIIEAARDGIALVVFPELFLLKGQAAVKIEMDEPARARIGSPILRDEKFISSLYELKRIRKKTFGH